MQVSYASTSPVLKDRELYPHFFRTISSDLAFNPARAALLRKYGWKRVATLHQNEPSGIFSQVSMDVYLYPPTKLSCMFVQHPVRKAWLAAAFNIALKWLSMFDLPSNIFIKTFAHKKMFDLLATLCMVHVNTMLASPFTAVEATLTNSEGYNLTPRLTTQLL